MRSFLVFIQSIVLMILMNTVRNVEFEINFWVIVKCYECLSASSVSIVYVNQLVYQLKIFDSLKF